MILVTGGAGFIGSHIVDALVAAGEDVRALDLLEPGVHARVPDYLNPDAELVRGDVRDPATVAESLRGATAVCHQASMVGLGKDFVDVEAYVRHNDLGRVAEGDGHVALPRPTRSREQHGRLRRGALRVRRPRPRGATAARGGRPP
jgi:uncharacterized protein YbjT (DUF2867 family)